MVHVLISQLLNNVDKFLKQINKDVGRWVSAKAAAFQLNSALVDQVKGISCNILHLAIECSCPLLRERSEGKVLKAHC